MNTTNKKNSKIQNFTSLECYNELSKSLNSYLIDVRTKTEWIFVGVPDLSSINKNVIFVSWLNYPYMQINSFFENQIMEFNIYKNDKLFFLCRSGNRSYSAAEFLTSRGFSNCFNVIDGFEGELNSNHQRSTINGWKFNNLPWEQ